MPYCPRCGNEVTEEDEFCSKCRTPLKEGVVYHRVRRRDEKDEKDEKGEKGEKGEDDKYGPIVGGLIVVWLGVLLLLSNQNIIRSSDFGGYFLMGIGAILVLRGLLATQDTGFDSGFGYMIGGGVMVLIGVGITYNLEDWWAIMLIGLGLIIVLRGITERGRNPIPRSSTQ
ncbi:MAG: zinc ribbon domain-containing protein [bacterium]